MTIIYKKIKKFYDHSNIKITIISATYLQETIGAQPKQFQIENFLP